MRNHRNLISVFALLMLALAPAAAVLADEPMAGESTLTGQLSRNADGAYILVEEESGDSIVLTGSQELEEYVGSAVMVTGAWDEETEEQPTFRVSKVKPVDG